MRFASLLLLGLVLLAMPASAAAATPEPGADAVLIDDFAFSPPEMTVTAGESVTWTFGSDPEQHTVTPADGEAFDGSRQLFTDDTFVVRFDEAGTFAYLCTLHPFMTGTVTVVAAAASPSAVASPVSSAAPSPVPSAVPTPGATPAAAVVDPVGAAAGGSPARGVRGRRPAGLVAWAPSWPGGGDGPDPRRSCRRYAPRWYVGREWAGARLRDRRSGPDPCRTTTLANVCDRAGRP